MRRFHNYMKDTPAFQSTSEGHQEFRFKPFQAWMVFTDRVSHACLSGQHAFADTFVIRLGSCRLPEMAPDQHSQIQAGMTAGAAESAMAVSTYPPRILFIRLSAVGDVINTLPALEALRRGLPDAFIGYVVEDRAHDLITRHPSVDRVHLYRRKRGPGISASRSTGGTLYEEFSTFLHEIRREQYTVALDFQGNLKGAMHGLFSGARRRVGFSRGHCKENNFFFNNEHVTPPGGTEKINRVEKFLSLVGHLGVPVTPRAYRLPETRDGRARVDAFLARTA
jgi:hypothetical protein